MRKLRAALCAVMAVVLLSLSILTFAADYSEYNLCPEKDSGSFYIVGVNGRSAVTRNISESKAYIYSFGEDIAAWCISRGKLFVFNYTDQSDVALIHIAAKGSIERSVTIFGLKTRRASLRVAADKKENIYIIDSDGYVEVFDKNGGKLRTTAAAYRRLTSYGGKVYAAGSSGLSLLSESSDKLIMNCAISGDFSFVTDSIISDAEGNVYDLSEGKLLFSAGSEYAGRLSEANRYFIAASGKRLVAFDKESGELAGSSNLDFAPVAVYCKGDTINLIKSNLSFQCVSENKLFPESVKKAEVEDNTQRPTSVSKDNPQVNFGKYEVIGEYIIIPKPITRTVFKDNINVDGYKISFSTSRGVGTGTKMTLTGDNAEYTYTLVTRADVSGEGNTNDKDLEIVMDSILDLIRLEGAKKIAADMDGDGKITVFDLHYMLRCMQGYDWEKQLELNRR